MTARYIDAAETAKLIRGQLRRTFPGVKFSVRTSRYSGGASVDVYWTDGPTDQQVRQAIDVYAGKGFERDDRQRVSGAGLVGAQRGRALR